jgi:hypothetical protein
MPHFDFKSHISYAGHVGRKKRWAEDMQARFPEGTFARVGAVLRDREDRTDFVREAVERELKRRERQVTPGRKRRAKAAH